jgi:hypothetical protein
MSIPTPFCTDIDLLHWEPNLLRDAAFVSQTLIAGTGALDGTTFTLSAGSLTSAKVARDMAIVLDGPVNGCFPITSIDSETELTISVLYDRLSAPAADEQGSEEVAAPEAVAVAAAAAPSIAFSIRTFKPQRLIVSELLAQAAGTDRARRNEVPAQITSPSVLRRPCALGTLQMIYSALAAAAGEDAAHLATRADLYERLYRRALRSTTVSIDLDGDGRPDVERALNVLDLQRA